MRGMVSGLNRTLFGAAVTTLLVLQGCSTTAPVGSTSEPVTSEITPVEVAEKSLFEQASEALDNGEFGVARQTLQQLQQTEMSRSEQTDWLILVARLTIATDDLENATVYLTELGRRNATATSNQQLQIKLVSADWYEAKGEFLAAARIRVFTASDLDGDLSDPTSQSFLNHQAIWRNLQQMPREELTQKALDSKGTVLGQWMALSAIGLNPGSIEELLTTVGKWQKLFPNHPAARVLPGSLAYLQTLAIERPDKVALLLPLSGPLAKSGEAIRDGFMASYYQALDKNLPTPELVIYDSETQQDVELLYANALMDSVDWIVGPVSKQAVTQLEQAYQLPVPTLALNQGEQDQPDTEFNQPDNLFEYGLPPEDEAVQIAELAHQQGLKRALVMIPEGTWGERIYSAFWQRWTELDGDVAEVVFYGSEKDFNPNIRSLLNVDESADRAREIRRIVGTPVQFEPRRREDADWLFLVAQPQQARQIKPTLAFNFASDLPVYSTSHVFSGRVDQRADRDLNGIQFCDLPWVLSPNTTAKTVEEQTPGGQGPYLRLYAMGADAYHLTTRIKQLKAFPYSSLQGNTGKLTLNDKQRVKRQTECQQFVNGKPTAL